MNNLIFFFLKVFENEEYANSFIEGKLFLNRLSYFKNLEELELANRTDRFEGAVSWHQPDRIKIEINGREITDLAGPVSIQMNWHDYLHVFCVYAAHTEKRSYETKDEMHQQVLRDVSIPEDLIKLGQYGVLVSDWREFKRRLLAAAGSFGYRIRSELVEYYDPTIFHGDFSEIDAVFKKHDIYQHQREYRFAIDSGIAGNDPIFIDIGDLSDITMRVNPSELNNQIDFQRKIA